MRVIEVTSDAKLTLASTMRGTIVDEEDEDDDA